MQMSVSDTNNPLYLWKVESNTARVFIAGSVHIMKPDRVIPKQFDEAFEQSSQIVVEMNTQSKETAGKVTKYIQQYGLCPFGYSLIYYVTGDTLNRLERRCQSLNKNSRDYYRFKPVVVASLICSAQIEKKGFNKEHGLDSYFLSKAQNRKIIELEGAEDQLPFYKESSYTQGEYLEETLKTLDKQMEDVRTIEALWNAGDDKQLLEKFYSTCSNDTRRRVKQENATRNTKMANKIERLLKTDGTYFALIGCIHTVGDDSIIAKLKDRGISCTRYNANDDLK